MALIPALLFASLLSGRQFQPSHDIHALVGRRETYPVRRGESLFVVARSHNVSLMELLLANDLAASDVRAGTRLLLPTLHVLPMEPHDGVVLNIPERAVYIFRDGRFLSRFPVAVGKPSTQTAQGTYEVRNRIVNPTWTPPHSMVVNEGVRDTPVPPGPNNPLGDRWMGWSRPGFGFHSTTRPSSIGETASHGCVRLYPERARQMFEEVTVGMPIYAIYEPVVVGENNGKYYLAVFPDVYHSGQVSLDAVQKKLDRLGLLPLVDPGLLITLIEQQQSYPRKIAGEDIDVVVNGRPVDLPIAPVFAQEEWVVPVRAVAEALGATIEPAEDGVDVKLNGHTLSYYTWDTQADLDGAPLKMRVKPTRVEGVLMAPLWPLARLTGADVKWQKGKALVLGK